MDEIKSNMGENIIPSVFYFNSMAEEYRFKTFLALEKMEWFQNILTNIKEASSKGFFSLAVPLSSIQVGYFFPTKCYFIEKGFSVQTSGKGKNLLIKWCREESV